MDWKKDAPLREGMVKNPVVYHEYLDFSDEFYPEEEELYKVFTRPTINLMTWGRTKGKLEDDPHWIGMQFQKRRIQPLHIDPKYPRFSHHLKFRVDSGLYVKGISNEPLEMKRGLFYILDTHSPHQVYTANLKAVWNIAVSVDFHEPQKPKDCIKKCLQYAREKKFVTEEFA